MLLIDGSIFTSREIPFGAPCIREYGELKKISKDILEYADRNWIYMNIYVHIYVQEELGAPLVSSKSGDGVTPGQNYDLTGVVSWGKSCAHPKYHHVYARFKD